METIRRRAIHFLSAMLLPAAVLAQVPLATQTQSTTPSPSSSPAQLGIDTAAAISAQERLALLSKMTLAQRREVAQPFHALKGEGTEKAKINAFYFTWGALDPIAALDDAVLLATPAARSVAINAITFGMSPANSEAVAKKLTTLGDNQVEKKSRESFVELSLVKWSQVNPAAAAKYLAQLYPGAAARLAHMGPNDGSLMGATRGVAMNWGASDAKAALTWFHQGKTPNWVAIQNVIAGWWRKDPNNAANYVTQHLRSNEERRIAGMMSTAMAAQDLAKGAAWTQWIENETLRKRARLQIVTAWSSKDPKAAAQWITTLPDKERGPLVTVAVAIWAMSDAKAASAWADSPADNEHDSAMAGLASGTSAQSYDTALDWAAKIQDPVMKQRVTRAVIKDWMQSKPNEASAWVTKSKLPEKEKQALLEGQ